MEVNKCCLFFCCCDISNFLYGYRVFFFRNQLDGLEKLFEDLCILLLFVVKFVFLFFLSLCQ